MSKRSRENTHILYDPPEAAAKYPSIDSFDAIKETQAPSALVKSLCGTFNSPTPVQSHSWPLLFAGLDVIAVARTGSGKTIGFGIPAMAMCLKMKPPKGTPAPYVLAIAPTRELAMQTALVLEKAGKEHSIGVCCLYGGAPKWEQREKLIKAMVLVATPGRLVDMVQEGSLTLSSVKFFILDEADRMLDLGFEPEARKISLWIKEGRQEDDVQTAMYTATWPKSIQGLAATFLRKKVGSVVRVTAGNEGDDIQNRDDDDIKDGPRANTSVTQHITVLMNPNDKDRQLSLLLNKLKFTGKKSGPRIIIFALYKKECERVCQTLTRNGLDAVSLHGDKSQADRTRSFNAFRDKEVQLLVATDVAARGVDLPNVDHVINYTFPLTIEDYVHRIGRTGRAGATGDSWTFFTPNEKGLAGSLVGVLKEANQEVPEDMYQFSMAVKRKKPDEPEVSLGTTQSTKVTFDDDSD
eukprot:Tbor_TRINITY_DN4471_c0_g1::TRINITY_DN4471_c0_g1_i1::g.7951::m.7951/K14811/DBP3; ATP-dependent RNA helicase DBP3